MSYLIKKNSKKKEIIFMNYELHGYKFNPKNNKAYLEVKEVTVVKAELIDNILSIKFNKIFGKLLSKVIDLLNDDDASESDAMLVMGEVELLRGIVLNKYQKFLKDEKEKLFMQKLNLLENELRVKVMMIRERKMALVEEMEKGHSL